MTITSSLRTIDRIAIAIALAAIAMLAWGYRNAGTDPVVRQATVQLDDMPRDASPIRALLLADLHVAGPDTPPERIARLVEQANALRPDIVLIAGDFVAHKRLAISRPAFAAAVEPLRGLRARLGTFAVLGNHDQWRGEAEASAAIRAVGIRLLDNEAVEVGPLALGGVDDAFTGNDDVAATTDAMERMKGAKVLLSHSPDVMPEVPASTKMVVAGHTHCGQVSLPVLGPVVTMSRFGRRYACGIVREGGRTLVFTAGIGTSLLPIRFGAPPDMWLITIKGTR